MATTPALTVLHLSRLARHFPFSSSPLLTPLLFPCARLLPKPRDLPFRRSPFFPCNLSRRFSVAASTSLGLSDDGILDERYDVIVVGGGHAGCEAALASARLGAKTLLLTLNIDRIAWQPCNPAVGGPAKSQLVHEVDALGGEIGKISDRCYLQKRVLNASRGPAVRALRAQTDKREYAMEMRKIVESTPNLSIREAMVTDILLGKNDNVEGVQTFFGMNFYAPSVILTTGTFMSGKIWVGRTSMPAGRAGESASLGLTENLQRLGFETDRLKTGTPARVDCRTVDFSGLEPQHGDEEVLLFNPICRSHEDMSVKMVDHIVNQHHIDIDPQMIKRVKEMILASSEFAMPRSSREKRFLYEIVANGRNGIDVDKFDYIVRDCRACGLGCNFEFQRLMETMRVMDDEICYRAKDYLTVHKLFATRADLYRTVYTHPKVKAIELMVVDALVKANDYLDIASHIEDPSQYWKLDDTIIRTIETAPNEELKEARDLILRIRRRNLYQFCNEYAVPKDKMDNFKNVTAQDIVCSQKSGVTLKEEDVAVCNVRIDLTRGRHSPLESINFFQDYDSEEKFTIREDHISHLLPTSYQDMIVRVYSKKPELVGAISEAFENFQLKTYGVKAQVHATPEKKKRRILS